MISLVFSVFKLIESLAYRYIKHIAYSRVKILDPSSCLINSAANRISSYEHVSGLNFNNSEKKSELYNCGENLHFNLS